MRNFLNKALCLILALLVLPLPARAEDTFNANAFSIQGGADSFTVTIGDENGAVLEAEHAAGRTAQATVDCEFPKAYVLHENEVVGSYVNNGEITFDIPSAGDYEIVGDSRFAIANTNMVFGNSLAMNFWIRKSDVSDGNYYAEIKKYYADNQVLTTEIPFAEWEDHDEGYFRVSCRNIAAKEMSDEVTVQIFRNDGTPVSYLYSDSVRGYAMDMLRYYSSGRLATALVDMLNYGTAAQQYFNYNTGDLANSQLTARQRGLATKEATAQMYQEATGGSFVGTSLVLENNILLNLYFVNVTEGMYAEVSFIDHYGTEKTYLVDQFWESAYGKAVQVDALAVADGRQHVSCTLYNTDGTVASTCQTSVEDYIARMLDAGRDNDGLYDSIMKFVTSAHAYFHP